MCEFLSSFFFLLNMKNVTKLLLLLNRYPKYKLFHLIIELVFYIYGVTAISLIYQFYLKNLKILDWNLQWTDGSVIKSN